MSGVGEPFPMQFVLQRRGKLRETGAFSFQRWLAECRARGFRVWLAWDESHAWAEPVRAAAGETSQ